MPSIHESLPIVIEKYIQNMNPELEEYKDLQDLQHDHDETIDID